MSGSGVRLIFRSMSGSVQLKNLGFKSLTNWRYRNQSFLSATLPPDQGKALGFAVELSFLLSQGL